MKRGKRKFLKQIIAFAFSLCLISGLIKPMEARAVSANSGNQTFCAGTYFSAFIKEDNSLWTCGGSGIIGKGLIMSEEWNWMQGSGGVPVKVMDDAKSVYSNDNQTCYVIKTDNSLWALGKNDGAFGDGTLQHSKTPVKIMDDVVYVESRESSWLGAKDEEFGYSHIDHGYASIALKSDGTLWSWGTNHWGEVGDGTKEPRLAPVKIMDNVACATNAETSSGMTDTIISTYAVKTDGSLWAWGANDWVQLGNGTTNSQVTPVKITDNVQTITAVDGTCAIIKNDGSYWVWGRNFTHVVDARIYYSPIKSPKKITDNVQSVTTSANDKYFLKKDGSLWAWGKLPALDLVGSGQPFERAEPIKIMDSVRYIHQGKFTTFAIRTDNSLWGWGLNSEGEIGIGDTTIEFQTNPIVIMDNVFSVYTTSFDTYILRTDGTLWGCGDDNYSQFGQGTYDARRSSPVKIADNVRLN